MIELERIKEKIERIKKKFEKLETELEKYREITTRKPLPVLMEDSDDVYTGAYSIRTAHTLHLLRFRRIQDYFLINSYLDEIIERARIKDTDSALTVFNKILGVVQTYCKYMYDFSQWGHSERFSLPFEVWKTKADDCESTSMLTIAAFEWYEEKYRKFDNADIFIGLGYYAKKYGHGFIIFCNDLNSIDLKDYYVGESTLSSATPAKPLSIELVRENYDCRWGLGNRFHSCRIKKGYEWWAVKKETKKRVRNEKEFKEKKKKIEELWEKL